MPLTGSLVAASKRAIGTTKSSPKKSPIIAALDAHFSSLTIHRAQTSLTGGKSPPRMQVANAIAESNLGTSKASESIHPFSTKASKTVASSELCPTADEVLPPASELQEHDGEAYSYKTFDAPVPRVVYCTALEEAETLVPHLKGPVVALDLEWKILQRRNQPLIRGRVAVVQVADESLVLVIQVYRMPRFPLALKKLIEDHAITKVGVNILNDGKKLWDDYGVSARRLVELGGIVRVVDAASRKRDVFGGRRIVSLARLVHRYLSGRLLLKGAQRVSDWQKPLSAQQIDYAANDAHSTLMVYLRLVELARKEQISLDDPQFSLDVAQSLSSPTGRQLPSLTDDVGSVVTPLTVSTTSSNYISRTSLTPQVEPGMRPQELRAYKYWHEDHMNLKEMCARLSTKGEPLKPGTVISYVVGALSKDRSLPCDVDALFDLVQSDSWSWKRHHEFCIQMRRRGLWEPTG